MQPGDSRAAPVAPVAMPTEVTVAEKLRVPAKNPKGSSVGKAAMGPGWNTELRDLAGNDAPGSAAGTAIHGMG